MLRKPEAISMLIKCALAASMVLKITTLNIISDEVLHKEYTLNLKVNADFKILV